MSAPWLLLAALDGALFVVLGATGRHGTIAAPDLQRLFDTANAYHAWHALAVLGVAVAVAQMPLLARRLARFAGAAFLLGSTLFCGPLYLRALWEMSALGPLTPVGGALLIVGWLSLAAAGGAAWYHTRV